MHHSDKRRQWTRTSSQSSPPMLFKTLALTDACKSRLEHLQELMETIPLEELFSRGIYIAGGAALYVLDTKQSLNDLGDIDFWVPPSRRKFVEDLIYGYKGPRLIRRSTGGPNARIIYFFIEKVQIQFIFLSENSTVPQLLRSFDFEANQCAIIDHNYSVASWVFMDILRTRVITWVNVSQINYRRARRGIASYRTRYLNRREKLHRKGFIFSDIHGPPPPLRTDNFHVTKMNRVCQHILMHLMYKMCVGSDTHRPGYKWSSTT